jgi:hypothetical protein
LVGACASAGGGIDSDDAEADREDGGQAGEGGNGSRAGVAAEDQSGRQGGAVPCRAGDGYRGAEPVGERELRGVVGAGTESGTHVPGDAGVCRVDLERHHGPFRAGEVDRLDRPGQLAGQPDAASAATPSCSGGWTR